MRPGSCLLFRKIYGITSVVCKARQRVFYHWHIICDCPFLHDPCQQSNRSMGGIVEVTHQDGGLRRRHYQQATILLIFDESFLECRSDLCQLRSYFKNLQRFRVYQPIFINFIIHIFKLGSYFRFLAVCS